MFDVLFVQTKHVQHIQVCHVLLQTIHDKHGGFALFYKQNMTMFAYFTNKT